MPVTKINRSITNNDERQIIGNNIKYCIYVQNISKNHMIMQIYQHLIIVNYVPKFNDSNV